MNDILKKALAAQQADSEQFTAALALMQQDIPTEEKQTSLEHLAAAAPAHEQSQFNDLFEKLTREDLNGR
jgi:hypothetical protein